jgi:predicted  nucleic acid-binding Zn-ribbon protein
MNKDVADKLKKIDDEISNALDTISDLEDKLTTVKTDEEGHILQDECSTLKEKFAVFNKSLQELTRLLVESGILEESDID